MQDVANIRSEIKSWERSFKQQHGRAAGVQDIRDAQGMEQKYKLYKKLAKATATTSVKAETDGPPSTPLRPQKRDNTRPELLLSKPRVGAPLATYNPFSPVKNKGIQTNQHVQQATRSNLFGSPLKATARALLSDTLPTIILVDSTASTSTQTSPVPGHAVARARKRLRGEPVSPSPNKEKRRRIGSHTVLPVVSLGSTIANDDDDDDDWDDVGEANSSFLEDSPVKGPAGGKSFRLLFEEALPLSAAGASTNAKRKGSLARARTTSSAIGLFGDRLDKSASVSSFVRKVKAHGDRRKDSFTSNKAIPSKSAPAKDDVFAEISSNAVRAAKAAKRRPSVSESGSRSSTTRSMSDTEMYSGEDVVQTTLSALRLIPPSPPADSSRSTSNHKGKGKAPVGSRKKTKVSEAMHEEEEDEEDSADDVQVKVVGPQGYYKQVRPGAGDEDDPILGYTTHRGPHVQGSVSDDLDSELYEGGNIDINLPDKFRDVLAISPSKARESRQERVVQGLLSGRRATHYDATKGGEIWDVGEEDELQGGDTEGEDDWEGEPVPWEVGEL